MQPAAELASTRQRGAGRVGMLGRCAERAERRVALELVDPSPVHRHDIDDDPEEAVEGPHDLARITARSKRRGAHEVDEEDGGVAHLAAKLKPAGKRRTRDLLADVAAE